MLFILKWQYVALTVRILIGKEVWEIFISAYISYAYIYICMCVLVVIFFFFVFLKYRNSLSFPFLKSWLCASLEGYYFLIESVLS